MGTGGGWYAAGKGEYKIELKLDSRTQNLTPRPMSLHGKDVPCSSCVVPKQRERYNSASRALSRQPIWPFNRSKAQLLLYGHDLTSRFATPACHHFPRWIKRSVLDILFQAVKGFWLMVQPPTSVRTHSQAYTNSMMPESCLHPIFWCGSIFLVHVPWKVFWIHWCNSEAMSDSCP